MTKLHKIIGIIIGMDIFLFLLMKKMSRSAVLSYSATLLRNISYRATAPYELSPPIRNRSGVSTGNSEKLKCLVLFVIITSQA